MKNVKKMISNITKEILNAYVTFLSNITSLKLSHRFESEASIQTKKQYNLIHKPYSKHKCKQNWTCSTIHLRVPLTLYMHYSITPHKDLHTIQIYKIPRTPNNSLLQTCEQLEKYLACTANTTIKSNLKSKISLLIQ